MLRCLYRGSVTLSAALLLCLVAWPWSYRAATDAVYFTHNKLYCLETFRGGIYLVYGRGPADVDITFGELKPDRFTVFKPSGNSLEGEAQLEINRSLPCRRFRNRSYIVDFSVLVIPHWTLGLVFAILPAHVAWRCWPRRMAGGAGFEMVAGG